MSKVQILIVDDGRDEIAHMALDIIKRYGAQVSRVTPDRIGHTETGTMITLDKVMPINRLTNPQNAGGRE